MTDAVDHSNGLMLQPADPWFFDATILDVVFFFDLSRELRGKPKLRVVSQMDGRLQQGFTKLVIEEPRFQQEGIKKLFIPQDLRVLKFS